MSAHIVASIVLGNFRATNITYSNIDGILWTLMKSYNMHILVDSRKGCNIGGKG
jgi:hypothetical protein